MATVSSSGRAYVRGRDNARLQDSGVHEAVLADRKHVPADVHLVARRVDDLQTPRMVGNAHAADGGR